MTELTFSVQHANLLTANRDLHWAPRAEIIRTLRTTGELAARNAHIPALGRAHLTVHITWPDLRRRDRANISPTIKALIDGIVDAGCLCDDDDDHLSGPDLRVTTETSGTKGVTGLRFVFSEYVEKVA